MPPRMCLFRQTRTTIASVITAVVNCAIAYALIVYATLEAACDFNTLIQYINALAAWQTLNRYLYLFPGI